MYPQFLKYLFDEIETLYTMLKRFLNCEKNEKLCKLMYFKDNDNNKESCSEHQQLKHFLLTTIICSKPKYIPKNCDFIYQNKNIPKSIYLKLEKICQVLDLKSLNFFELKHTILVQYKIGWYQQIYGMSIEAFCNIKINRIATKSNNNDLRKFLKNGNLNNKELMLYITQYQRHLLKNTKIQKNSCIQRYKIFYNENIIEQFSNDFIILKIYNQKNSQDLLFEYLYWNYYKFINNFKHFNAIKIYKIHYRNISPVIPFFFNLNVVNINIHNFLKCFIFKFNHINVRNLLNKFCPCNVEIDNIDNIENIKNFDEYSNKIMFVPKSQVYYFFILFSKDISIL